MTEVTHADLVRSRMVMVHSSTYLVYAGALTGGIGLVDETIPDSQNEDWDLALRAARRHPLVNVDQPLVRVVWGASSHYARQWQAKADSLRWMLAHHPELADDRPGAARSTRSSPSPTPAWGAAARPAAGRGGRCAATGTSAGCRSRSRSRRESCPARSCCAACTRTGTGSDVMTARLRLLVAGLACVVVAAVVAVVVTDPFSSSPSSFLACWVPGAAGVQHREPGAGP